MRGGIFCESGWGASAVDGGWGSCAVNALRWLECAGRRVLALSTRCGRRIGSWRPVQWMDAFRGRESAGGSFTPRRRNARLSVSLPPPTQRLPRFQPGAAKGPGMLARLRNLTTRGRTFPRTASTRLDTPNTTICALPIRHREGPGHSGEAAADLEAGRRLERSADVRLLGGENPPPSTPPSTHTPSTPSPVHNPLKNPIHNPIHPPPFTLCPMRTPVHTRGREQSAYLRHLGGATPPSSTLPFTPLACPHSHTHSHHTFTPLAHLHSLILQHP